MKNVTDQIHLKKHVQRLENLEKANRSVFNRGFFSTQKFNAQYSPRPTHARWMACWREGWVGAWH
jgi:hypothetical protein